MLACSADVRRGVGYSVTRDMMKAGFDKDTLPAFDRIPSSKLGVVPLVFRFVIPRRCSVAVFTERLGPQGHHRRVVLLVNEHSASAAEIVAAFASENRLATLVGTKTAGCLRFGERIQGRGRLSPRSAGGRFPHVAREQSGRVGCLRILPRHWIRRR